MNNIINPADYMPDTLYEIKEMDNTKDALQSRYNYTCFSDSCASQNAIMQKATHVLAWTFNDHSSLSIMFFDPKDYLIKNQDAQTFQEIAWMLDENENKKNTKYVFMEIYKWQYLCHKLCISFEDSNRALSEMNIISKINLSDTDVKNAILDAKKWIDKNWNKPVQNKKNNIVDIKDKTIVDLIRNALIRD